VKNKSEVKLSKEQQNGLSEFLDKHMGIYYSEKSWRGFEKKIPEIAESLGYDDISKCIDSLIHTEVSNDLISILAQHLTIGETYFFRENDSLETIKKKILYPLIQERRKTTKHLRIWSAASCTGEEAYSIAMILSEMIPNIEEWSIYILATDINLQFLQTAKEGVYREWSFRNTSEEEKARYFIKRDEKYHLHQKIKDMVHFRYLNLVENNYPSLSNGTESMDLILCKNVLIYFSKNQINKVIGQLGCSLLDGGYLCVTSVEAPFIDIQNLVNAKEIAGNLFRTNNVIPEKKESQITKNNSFIDQFLKQPKKLINELKNVPEGKQTKVEPQTTESTDYYKISKQYFDKKDYSSLIEYLESCFSNKIINQSESINYDILLIRAYANIGNFLKAKQWCERSIENEKTEAVLYYLYAIILQECSEFDLAIKELNKATFLDSDFAIAYFTLGNIYLMKNELAYAKRNFRNVMMILEKYNLEYLVPEAEGLTAGRLKEIIQDIESKITGAYAR